MNDDQQLLDRYRETREAFRQVACIPNAMQGWNHTRQFREWTEVLKMIKDQYPMCEYPNSHAEYYLKESGYDEVSNS